MVKNRAEPFRGAGRCRGDQAISGTVAAVTADGSPKRLRRQDGGTGGRCSDTHEGPEDEDREGHEQGPAFRFDTGTPFGCQPQQRGQAGFMQHV